MKTQILAVSVLAVFLLSMMPAVMAEQNQTPQAVQYGTADNASGNATGNDSNDTPMVVQIKTRAEQAIQTLTQIKERLRTNAATLEDVRQYQQEKLQAALGDCNTTDCQEKIQARINLTSQLQEKALTALQNLLQNKDRIIQKLQEMSQSEEFSKFKERAKDFVARSLSAEKKENARLKLQIAQQNFEQAKERLNQAKSEFDQTRERIQACSDDQSEECLQLQEQIRLNSKQFLNETLDLIENHLRKVRSSLESSETLTEEEAAEEIADIDEQLSNIEALRARVAELGEDTPKEDVLNLTQQIRNMWTEEAKNQAQQAAGFVQLNQMGGIYVKMRNLERKLNLVMERMAELGKDTATAENLVSQFDEKLDEAESYYGLAQAKFKEASMLRAAERQTAIREANAQMTEAKASLKDAHEILKDVVREFVSQGVEDELEEDEATDAVESQEDEIAEEASEEA